MKKRKVVKLSLTDKHEILTEASLVPKSETRYAKERLNKVKQAVKNTGGFFCYLCHKEILLSDLTLDHVVPLDRGGKNHSKNLRIAHMLCNSAKSNMDLTYYRMFSKLEKELPRWFKEKEIKRSKDFG